MAQISHSQGLVTDEEVVFLLQKKTPREILNFCTISYRCFDLEEMEELIPDIEGNHIHLSVSQVNQFYKQELNGVTKCRHAEYTCLVWFVYFDWQFYSLPKNFWFRHAVANVWYNINRDQKPVSTIFIRNLENNSPRSCVRVNRCPSVKSTNTSIKAEQTDLR